MKYRLGEISSTGVVSGAEKLFAHWSLQTNCSAFHKIYVKELNTLREQKHIGLKYTVNLLGAIRIALQLKMPCSIKSFQHLVIWLWL